MDRNAECGTRNAELGTRNAEGEARRAERGGRSAEGGGRRAEGQQPVLGLSKLAPGAPAEQGAPQEQQCQSGGLGNGNRTDVQKDCLGHI
jgi:hypothetical protein